MIATRASMCVVLAAIIVGLGGGASAAEKIRLAQTSVTTTCMMTCNAQYANCQSSCLATGTQYNFGTQQESNPTNTTTSGATVNANQTCISSCTNQQLSCQLVCAQSSPSR